MSKCLHIFAALFAVTVGVQAQDSSKERLEKSRRHQEWVQYRHGDRTVHAFLVFPETKDKAPAVIVIHEIFGLTDWVRGVADQLAEAGYIAIAPDLLSGMGPKGGRSSDFTGRDGAREAIGKLPPEQISADLNQVADEAKKLPACNGKIAVSGFCWGGMQTFRFATNRSDLSAAYVFYGNPPEKKEDFQRIKCPVYGFYGEKDARVNATIQGAREAMKEAGKTYEPEVYDGAGHGFFRTGEESSANAAEKKAREEAWKRWKELLKKI
jgi:carboxymethylenebutenolidase